MLIGLLDPEITREDKETKLAIVKDNKLHHLIIKAVVEARTMKIARNYYAFAGKADWILWNTFILY